MRWMYIVFSLILLAICANARDVDARDYGTDIFTVLPGKCNCASLNDILDLMPHTPGGREFIEKFANDLSQRFGIPIPPLVLDMILNNATMLLDYMVVTPADMQLMWMALNLARDQGDLKPVEPTLPTVPDYFDVADLSNFYINVSSLLPPLEPTVLVPGLLYQAYTRGNVSLVQDEVVMSIILDQLAENNHMSPTNTSRFHVRYNNETYDDIEGLFTALLNNDHSIEMWLTWRAVDFFGYLTKNATTGEFMSVPVPLFTATGIYDSASGEEAVLPAIHNEYVIQVKPGPKTVGTRFLGNLLWYEGDDGIGFFAQDIYAVGNWVGTMNSEYVSGAAAVQYISEMGIISDALIETARANDLYDWGYGVTGVCVDSTGILEGMHFGGASLYPMVMQKDYILAELPVLMTMNSENVPIYKEITTAVNNLQPDVYNVNPTTCQRALNSLSWKEGDETFQVAADARRILSSVCH